ncbi:preprotein translocase subunit TatB [Synergistales bacterium]|nr:preprotein translocase subunit TatB [Synergistales bacterium]
MKKIDARGKPCPQPVMLTKAGVDAGEKEFEILLDNPVSASNVTRYLEGQGFSVLLKDDDGLLIVKAEPRKNKPKPAPKPAPTPPAPVPSPISAPPKQTFSVLITGQTLGRNDQELGEVLMKGFLGTCAQIDAAPIVVAMMNEGVKLALQGSATCDHLKSLEGKGVAVLVCGTCTNHFAITEQIGAGVISNMFEIIESINKASKVITL